jgi:hypothetical protein
MFMLIPPVEALIDIDWCRFGSLTGVHDSAVGHAECRPFVW